MPLEMCLTDEGLDVERGEPEPIQIPPAGTFTPEAILVESGDSSIGWVELSRCWENEALGHLRK
jgi:hypothetical protein